MGRRIQDYLSAPTILHTSPSLRSLFVSITLLPVCDRTMASTLSSLTIVKPTVHRPTVYPKFTTFSQITLKQPHSIKRLLSVAEGTSPVTAADPSSEAARRLYVGNIPRKVDNAELTGIVKEYGSVEKIQVLQILLLLCVSTDSGILCWSFFAIRIQQIEYLVLLE